MTLARCTIAATAGGLFLAGCGGPGANETRAAYDECVTSFDKGLGPTLRASEGGRAADYIGTAADYITLDDDGHTVVGARPADTNGGELVQTLADLAVSGASGCVLMKLGAPSSLLKKIDSTTSIMGRQTEAWDGDAGKYEASWSYHPDNGLEIFIEEDE